MRLLILILLLVSPLAAQVPVQATKPVFYVFVDTTGVTATAPDVYVTWIFATSVPYPTPKVSSAIQVAFDCKGRKVARQYHVVYHLNADSSGVLGPIQEDPGTWVDVTSQRTFDLVCGVGKARPYDPTLGVPQKPEPNQEMTGPDAGRLSPVS